MFPGVIDSLIDRALEEDLGSGDITSECCIEPDVVATATALSRHELVVCGGEVFARVFRRVDEATQVELIAADGTLVGADERIWRVVGRARSVLSAERVAVNLVQRMSGVAPMAQRVVKALPPDSRTRVTDTRKTTPGLRPLERYAVRTGGAHNHRDGLSSAVLIKDNHIVAAGGIEAAVSRAWRLAPHTSRIEVEVTSVAEFDQALAAGADVIMLDNMDTPMMAQLVARIARQREQTGRPLLEASGGISLARIAELADAGLDAISVGALTHSAPAADISLEFAFSADHEG